MAELPLIESDKDLVPLLRKASNELLDPLVHYITRNGWLTSELETTRAYQEHYPNHRMYADEIAAEIQKFGGNTIANLLRGGYGVPYKEVATDVAKRLKAPHRYDDDVATIEMSILTKILEKAYENMSEEEKRKLLEILGILESNRMPKSLPVMTIQALIKASGFKAYQIAVIVANAIAKKILGRGLSLAANAMLTKSMSIFAGPIGWAITGLWTILSIAGPAYRVTIPCVIQVALIRQHYLNNS